MCNGGAMQYIQYIYFMYVCNYVCEKYIKSISYKTTVVFRVHVVLYHIISRLDGKQSATEHLLMKNVSFLLFNKYIFSWSRVFNQNTLLVLHMNVTSHGPIALFANT